MKWPVSRATPAQFAWTFAVLASALVAAASLWEGTLFKERILRIGAQIFIQRPYVSNVSTILDFAIFDPIAIYFMLTARNGFKRAYDHFNVHGDLSPYQAVGLSFVSAALGISAMCFYYQGYIGGSIFTEAFAMDAQGRATVSITGWLIFAATSVFLSTAIFSVIEFGNYILFLRRLGVADFAFRLPPQLSEDVAIAARPCVCAAYVLATLFVVLVIVIIRDFWQLGLHQSRRVWLLAPYVAACLIAFLPFWHLHGVMAAQKRAIIDANNSVIEKDINSGTKRAGERRAAAVLPPLNPDRLLAFVERIERLQVFYRSIRVWPSSRGALLLPNISVAVSVITLTLKLIDSLKQH